MGITLTPKLQLAKADGDEHVDVVAHIDAAFDKIDAAMGIVLCTSSTRPATPYAGLSILETDSGFGYVWSGTAWLLNSRPYKQPADVATSETTTGGTYADLTTVGPTLSNIPLIAGNIYKITISAFMKNSNPAAISKMGFAVSGAETLAGVDTDAALQRNVDDNVVLKVCSYAPAVTGNHTIKAVYSSSGGATATFSQRRISIE